MKDKLPDTLKRRYLQGTLPADQKAALDKTLMYDPELHQEMERAGVEMAAGETLIAREIQGWMTEWNQEGTADLANPPATKTKNNLLLWLLPALMAIGFLVFWFGKRNASSTHIPIAIANPTDTLNHETTPNPQPPVPNPQPPIPSPQSPTSTPPTALAAAYFEEPIGLSFRTATDTAFSPFRRAETAYEQRDYQTTLDLLSSIDRTRNRKADWLYAATRFHLGQLDAAAGVYRRLIAEKDLQYQQSAEWQLLVCLVALLPESARECQTQLETIVADPDHPYRQKALELRKKL